MGYYDNRQVYWLAVWGRLEVVVVRYRCQSREQEQRALREILGVEPGRHLRFAGAAANLAGGGGAVRVSTHG